MPSLRTNSIASFTVNIDGDIFTGQYKGLAIIDADKNRGVKKLAATGFKELRLNGKVILNFEKPIDIFVTRQDGKMKMVLADSTQTIKPMINKL